MTSTLTAGPAGLERSRGEPFFFGMGLALLAVVVAGFAPSFLARSGDMPLLLHVHGAVFFAWFVLFCVQARLIGSGYRQLHIRIGQFSVILAATMLALGFFVIRGAYARPDWNIAGMSASASVMFPATDMINFAIAYGLALANRRKPAIHKRLMLLSGILIIDPAAARLVSALGGEAPLILLLEVSLFVALFAYDFKTRGKPSWPALLGLGLYIAAMAAKLTVAQHPVWHSLVDRLFA